MTILFSLLSFFLFHVDASGTHLGEWEYSVVTPDYTYKGIMTIQEEDGILTGSIASEGTEIELNDVAIEGGQLTFTMNVQGFPCSVKGTFEGDSFTGEVAVEGMALPMKATKVE